jgi:hypothetical protein
MANFQAHFTKANKERARKLTAQTAGYHGANIATTAPSTTTAPTVANAAVAPAPANPPPPGGRPSVLTTVLLCITAGHMA